ncbi:uncharacterized protein LOC143068079 [Mytilus galloprovincialis]|uniref:uncharacterized protein LOC143068079 n=1 Tax=Mytilus galloprovincialis TaxID=29158 RepID=UPI003F7BBDBC
MGTASSVQRSQVPIGCQLCQGRNTIQWKCVNCQFLMCTICKDNIHLRIAKDHKIISISDIGELDSGESFNFSDTHCKEHFDQVCCSYCSSCNTVVCVKCLMTVHNGHKFVDEADFLCKKKQIWKGKTSAVKKIDQLCKDEHKLKNIKQLEDEMYSKAIENIHEKAREDMDWLSSIIFQLDEKIKSVNQTIDTELTNIDREKGKVKEFIDIVDMITSSKDFCQFFEKFDELIASLTCDIKPLQENFGSISEFIKEHIIVSEFDHQNTAASDSERTDSDSEATELVKTYTTDIRSIHFLTELSDQTLLISDNQSEVLQHVKLEETNAKVIANFTIQIFGMAVSPSGDILVSTGDTILKVFDIKTGKMTDSLYSVHPFKSCAIHVNQDQRVIIGVRSSEADVGATGRCVVIVMDQEGNCLMEYEHDNNKIPLFTHPANITSTKDGNICVLDIMLCHTDETGRIVVLAPGGDVIQIYSGHPDINNVGRPFIPGDISTISSGGIIVTDTKTQTLHILDNDGQFIICYNILDIGINYPYSLAMSLSGHLYIGGTCEQGSPDTYKTKLYQLKYHEI